MLYALILAGFVFLFVTFWHFVVERLFWPIGKTNKRGMDFYIAVIVIVIAFAALNTYIHDWDSYFSLIVNALIAFAMLIFVYFSWNFMADKVSSSNLALGWRNYDGKWEIKGKIIVEDWRKVALDFLVGVVMAITFLLLLHKYPFLAEPEDASMDFAMKVVQLVNNYYYDNNRIPKIVLLNVDDETHKKWGEPLFTPRNRLKELIESAVEDGARLIVVDVFLSQKTGGDEQELSSYLDSYDLSCQDRECPPIILIRNSLSPPAGDAYFDVHNLPIRRIRHSFLEEAIGREDPIDPSSLIQWASPFFWESKFDGRLRRFWLWQPMCDEEKGKRNFFPSVELLAAHLIRNEDHGQGVARYQEALGNLKNITSSQIDPDFEKTGGCGDHYKPKSLSDTLILSKGKSEIDEGELSGGGINQRIMFTGKLEIEEGELSGGGINQRIMFTMPWKKEMSQEGASGEKKVTSLTYTNGRSLSVLSAYYYLCLKKEDSTAKTELKDSIVIIGKSHFDTTDIHKTPLGDMPGMLVIANAIHSLLLNGGQVKSLTLGKIVAEGILMLVILAGAFFVNLMATERWGRWFLATVTTLATMILIGFFMSAFLLKGGKWVDFSLPLVAMFFHHVVTIFHDLREKTKKAEKKAEEAEEAERKVKEKAKEEAEKLEKQWQTCQVELQTCKGSLRQCEQDKQQLFLNFTKGQLT